MTDLVAIGAGAPRGALLRPPGRTRGALAIRKAEPPGHHVLGADVAVSILAGDGMATMTVKRCKCPVYGRRADLKCGRKTDCQTDTVISYMFLHGAALAVEGTASTASVYTRVSSVHRQHARISRIFISAEAAHPRCTCILREYAVSAHSFCGCTRLVHLHFVLIRSQYACILREHTVSYYTCISGSSAN